MALEEHWQEYQYHYISPSSSDSKQNSGFPEKKPKQSNMLKTINYQLKLKLNYLFF
jgi:GH25 family lysozyme M1 (1,4-beta-N-acetylmuramidase)